MGGGWAALEGWGEYPQIKTHPVHLTPGILPVPRPPWGLAQLSPTWGSPSTAPSKTYTPFPKQLRAPSEPPHHWVPQTSWGWVGQEGAHSPSFLGARVKVPLTTLQWELSPPHTPHLSSCLLEPITPSQPTFCRGRGCGVPLRPLPPHQVPGTCSLRSPVLGIPSQQFLLQGEDRALWSQLGPLCPPGNRPFPLTSPGQCDLRALCTAYSGLCPEAVLAQVAGLLMNVSQTWLLPFVLGVHAAPWQRRPQGS